MVLKAVAKDLLHKSDEGGVLLDLRTPDDAEKGWAVLEERFGARLQGAVIQPFVASDIEVMAGLTRDPGAGTLLAFGLGGIHVELFGDVALARHPLTRAELERMPDEIRSAALLDGYRGRDAGDRDALVDLLARLNQLAGDLPELAELDLNPIRLHHRAAA